MDRAFTHQQQREEEIIHHQHQHQYQHLKLHCLPLVKLRTSNPFYILGFWVSKSLRNLCCGPRFSNGFCVKQLQFTGMIVNNSVFCSSPVLVEIGKVKMEGLIEKNERKEDRKDGFYENVGKVESFEDLVEEECRESSSSSDFLASEAIGIEELSHSSSELSSSSTHCSSSGITVNLEKHHLDDRKLLKQGSAISEIEMMKERFSKLLLGEDMSGSGNGVCTALAISNAITNLCATLFGQLWRLEPFPPEKKAMWRREMEWFLCVSDHIVELIPSLQTFPDGSKLELNSKECEQEKSKKKMDELSELSRWIYRACYNYYYGFSTMVQVMTCRPRSDLYVNLPALRKLDNMLLEVLDSFDNTDFWYVDQGILAPEADGSSSFRRALQRQEEKWWLPVPRVPPGGLHENSRKRLQHKRDCTNQILKAAMAINSITLNEMEVPESYLDVLPKNGRSSLGDLIYRYITSEQFSPECLLECIDLSSEHQALEIANRVEASIYVWRRRNNSKPINGTSRSNSKSSWGMVKDLMVDVDKRELLADRAESLLLCLKQRFPGLPQTTLDMSKIQYNKDVGKSIIESYSRVLESLAYNIVARIDDLLYVDDFTKHSDQFSLISKVGVLGHKSVTIPYSVPVPNTPYKTAFTTPSFSPAARLVRSSSPSAKGERSPFPNNNSSNDNSSKLPRLGFGVRKVLTDYLSADTTKEKEYGNHQTDESDLNSSTVSEVSASEKGTESSECRKEDVVPSAEDDSVTEKLSIA